MDIAYNLLLADDDADDCIFFKEALGELSFPTGLTVVNDGVELMNFLTKAVTLPDILFLDLNMPLKTGYDCLSEIKQTKKLEELPIIILSTSFNPDILGWLYEKGAHYYIRKPAEFSRLKEIIEKAIQLVSDADKKKPPKENFVLNNR